MATSNRNKQREEIEKATKIFQQEGGEIKTVEKEKTPKEKKTKTGNREKLAEIRRRKKEMADEEKVIRAELNENKGKYKAAQKKVRECHNKFEDARKEHGNAVKKINNIHLTKSAKKHFDEFNDAIADWIFKSGKMEESSKEYLNSIRELKEM